MSPDESSIASPVRLKRYEGFEQGLNIMGRPRGAPYKANNNPGLRNKSPPLKKSKRKETLENLNINFGNPTPTPGKYRDQKYSDQLSTTALVRRNVTKNLENSCFILD